MLAWQEGLDVHKVAAPGEERLKPFRGRLQLRAVEVEAEVRDDAVEEPGAACLKGLLRLCRRASKAFSDSAQRPVVASFFRSTTTREHASEKSPLHEPGRPL